MNTIFSQQVYIKIVKHRFTADDYQLFEYKKYGENLLKLFNINFKLMFH